MDQLTILCVEDEAEVRDALTRDLAAFVPALRVEAAEDVDDAKQVMQECADDGDPIGLVLCDHVMPGTSGVEFLVELNAAPATHPIRKVLITGQAGQEDTIKAVNEASLDHYIAKPWAVEELHKVIRDELTTFALENLDNLLPYVSVLDGPRLLEAVSHRRSDR